LLTCIQEYQKLVSEYIERQVVSKDESDNLYRLVFKNNYKEYEQLHLLASFIYPVIDSYWVTLCALSALNDVRALPLSLVPTLTQWVGMHLISGRRTIYSEVLSTEFSQTTVYSLVQLGLLVTKSAKLVLSPDAQMLMQALGLSTNDDLILQAPKDEQGEQVNEDDQAKQVINNILMNSHAQILTTFYI
jgi:hypothetical protein